MFERALVALDLSPAERPILDCLPALRQWGVNSLLLIHVMPVGYLIGTQVSYERDYLHWLEELAGPLREAGFAVEVQVPAGGQVAAEILRAADSTQADLIVIGSRGQNLIRKIFLGSVAREVVRSSQRPVLMEWIEPTAEATRQLCAGACGDYLRHVLLATDFSARATAAEQVTVALALKAARVDCLHVLEPANEPASGAVPVRAQAALDAIRQQIEAAGGKGTTSLLAGDASAEIIRHAHTQDASLIIVGKHGQGWLASVLTGSTAMALFEKAGRPLLLVP